MVKNYRIPSRAFTDSKQGIQGFTAGHSRIYSRAFIDSQQGIHGFTSGHSRIHSSRTFKNS